MDDRDYKAMNEELNQNQKGMKFIKILIDIKLWHLKPYKIKGKIGEHLVSERGFLCFKFVIVYK